MPCLSVLQCASVCVFVWILYEPQGFSLWRSMLDSTLFLTIHFSWHAYSSWIHWICLYILSLDYLLLLDLYFRYIRVTRTHWPTDAGTSSWKHVDVQLEAALCEDMYSLNDSLLWKLYSNVLIEQLHLLVNLCVWYDLCPVYSIINLRTYALYIITYIYIYVICILGTFAAAPCVAWIDHMFFRKKNFHLNTLEASLGRTIPFNSWKMTQIAWMYSFQHLGGMVRLCWVREWTRTVFSDLTGVPVSLLKIPKSLWNYPSSSLQNYADLARTSISKSTSSDTFFLDSHFITLSFLRSGNSLFSPPANKKSNGFLEGTLFTVSKLLRSFDSAGCGNCQWKTT